MWPFRCRERVKSALVLYAPEDAEQSSLNDGILLLTRFASRNNLRVDWDFGSGQGGKRQTSFGASSSWAQIHHRHGCTVTFEEGLDQAMKSTKMPVMKPVARLLKKKMSHTLN